MGNLLLGSVLVLCILRLQQVVALRSIGIIGFFCDILKPLLIYLMVLEELWSNFEMMAICDV